VKDKEFTELLVANVISVHMYTCMYIGEN